MRARIFGAIVMACGLSFAAFGDAPANDVDTLLHQAVAGSWRSDVNKARDQYRHPIETLEFFGLRPDMTVIELSPGGGWYTEILAPVLAERGQLIAAPGSTTGKYADRLKGNPAVFGKVKLIAFDPPKQIDLGADNSADMVVTFRNTHDWLNDDPQELAAVFASIYKVLKPDGILGVEEHRARPWEDAVMSSNRLHRITEDYMINLGLKNGFQLAGVSEVNANPNDDGTLNVHQLPPNLAVSDNEKPRMRAIGESDRMTLKFVKPLSH